VYCSLASASPVRSTRNLSSGVLRIRGVCNRVGASRAVKQWQRACLLGSNSETHCANPVSVLRGCIKHVLNLLQVAHQRVVLMDKDIGEDVLTKGGG
jgi:hypothetical protein